MHLHNEDLELQIKLAELQADVQINLTAFFTFLAIFISVLLTLQGIYFSAQQILDKTYIAILMLAGSGVCSGFLVLFFHRALTVRRKIGELRKLYALVGRMPPYLKPDQEN